MSKFLYSIVITSAVFLVSCGAIPNVNVNYYLPKVTVGVKVTQTGKCIDSGGNGNMVPLVTTNVEFTDKYSADRSNVYSIDLSDMESFFSSGHFQIDLADDGMLKGMDTEFTSQVSDALKTAISLVTTGGRNELFLDGTNLVKDACEVIKAFGSKDGFLTIVRTGNVDFARKGVRDREAEQQEGFRELLNLESINASTEFDMSEGNTLISALLPVFGEVKGLSAVYNIPAEQTTPVTISESSPTITLIEPAESHVIVEVGFLDHRELYSTQLWVPQNGETFKLSIPKAPMFGKTGTAFTLAENGRLTKLKYSADPGFGAANTIVTDLSALGEKSDQVAETKAEADLIYQQQRLLMCQEDSSNCTVQ